METGCGDRVDSYRVQLDWGGRDDYYGREEDVEYGDARTTASASVAASCPGTPMEWDHSADFFFRDVTDTSFMSNSQLAYLSEEYEVYHALTCMEATSNNPSRAMPELTTKAARALGSSRARSVGVCVALTGISMLVGILAASLLSLV